MNSQSLGLLIVEINELHEAEESCKFYFEDIAEVNNSVASDVNQLMSISSAESGKIYDL